MRTQFSRFTVLWRGLPLISLDQSALLGSYWYWKINKILVEITLTGQVNSLIIELLVLSKLPLSWQEKFVCLREVHDWKEFYLDDWALVPVDEKTKVQSYTTAALTYSHKLTTYCLNTSKYSLRNQGRDRDRVAKMQGRRVWNSTLSR